MRCSTEVLLMLSIFLRGRGLKISQATHLWCRSDHFCQFSMSLINAQKVLGKTHEHVLVFCLSSIVLLYIEALGQAVFQCKCFCSGSQFVLALTDNYFIDKKQITKYVPIQLT